MYEWQCSCQHVRDTDRNITHPACIPFTLSKYPYDVLYVLSITQGDAGVRGFGLKAENGRKWFWNASQGTADMGDDGMGRGGGAEAANKLYVGMLIMLIFSEALALYGLIVALILSQHSYKCGE